MPDERYRICDECGYAFKLGSSVASYKEKEGASIFCPLCSQDKNHRISKIEYEKIKNSRWFNK